jgi:hypothetical protein
MASLQCKDCTVLELSQGESPFPSAIRIALLEVLNAIDTEAGIGTRGARGAKSVGTPRNLFVGRYISGARYYGKPAVRS